MSVTETTKTEWVDEYAGKILKMWQNWQGPLGNVDEQYIEQLKQDLQGQYDDPLKRTMVEMSY